MLWTFLSDLIPCPNYVPNNSGSSPTEVAYTKLSFRGSYLSFLAGGSGILTIWRKHSRGDAGLRFSQEKRTFFFLQAHRCCWILVSQHKVWPHGSELFILWTQPVCLCLARATATLICYVWCFQSLMLQLPNNLGRAGGSDENMDGFLGGVWMLGLKDKI